ncbi:hypothetical protein PPYR_00021 [Photinus pyralis]|uniref:PiggyBac transposable element-derived protein domain-containing protein n=1 Tax=Photinus pyralis TaxID=7054 RepID=A0A5N4B0B2_PHOPY|nr:hypothetical protein PPYR_00019 [Photinus pyralis]KAB0803051.1 hypothetical protein PPYR_00021 [Photinus pyralis]
MDAICTTSFFGRKKFDALPQALDDVDDFDGAVDIVVLPPAPDVLTDEEDFDDNDLTNTAIPKDVPGSVELHFIAEEGDANIEAESDWSDSDDEPLAAKRPRKAAKIVTKNWKKCEPVYTNLVGSLAGGAKQRENNVTQALEGLNPLEIFEKLVDDKVIAHIVYQSNLYAQQSNRHTFSVNSEDMRTFIGILLFSGYHKLPRERLYWSSDEDMGVPFVSECMARNTYLQIKRNIHLADNSKLDKQDKLFKIRPFMNLINSKFQQWGIFHATLSIDEAMVRYFGRHSLKQFIKGKPVRFGFKEWMLCSATGFCYALDVYCGKNYEGQGASGLGLGSNVVLSMLDVINHPEDHCIYFDNFFTSMQLLAILKDKEFRCSGTIRDNRLLQCPLERSKSLQKKERGFYDYRFETKHEILIVKWKDNKHGE